MPGFSSRTRNGRPPATRSRARLALFGVAAAAGLAASVAGANPAAAVDCPPDSVLFGTVCFVVNRPTATTTPTTAAPTTTTTAAPLVSLPPVTVPPVTVPAPVETGSLPAAAQHLLELTNAERRQAGVGTLAWRDDVADLAVAHSQEMAQAGDIFHSTAYFGTAVKNLLNAAVRGENVAYNGDVDDAHARLMASPGHRANILDARFSVVGIGVVRAADGRYFITEDFLQPAGAPRPAAPAVTRTTAPAAPRRATITTPPTTPPTTAAPQPTTTVAPAPAPEPTTTTPPVTEPPAVTLAVAPASASGGVPAAVPLGAAAAVVLAGAAGGWALRRRRRA